MMIGIYSLANKRVDDAFLAAVLTVIGYSVLGTIVILDRIRENTKLMAGEAFDTIVNTSILQTMTRSVNTLATVVITLVALLAFGGASLQNFAFALLVGICSGGYHSIFFSAPLVAVLQKRSGHRRIFRRSSLQQPTTVAAARGQKAGAALRDREEIAAMRRARRERARHRVEAHDAAAALQTQAAGRRLRALREPQLRRGAPAAAAVDDAVRRAGRRADDGRGSRHDAARDRSARRAVDGAARRSGAPRARRDPAEPR